MPKYPRGRLTSALFEFARQHLKLDLASKVRKADTQRALSKFAARHATSSDPNLRRAAANAKGFDKYLRTQVEGRAFAWSDVRRQRAIYKAEGYTPTAGKRPPSIPWQQPTKENDTDTEFLAQQAPTIRSFNRTKEQRQQKKQFIAELSESLFNSSGIYRSPKSIKSKLRRL